MRKTRSLLILSTLLILQSNLGRAAEPPRLYALDKAAQPQVSRELVPDAAEEFLIDVDPARVAANPPSFLVDLPGIRSLKALRTRFVVYRPNWKSWFGTLRYAGAGGQEIGFVYIGYHGDQITGLLDFAGERYRIVGDSEGGHRLVRLSGELSPPPCGVDDREGSNPAPPLADPRQESNSTPSADAAPAPLALKTTARLDVLAVYPKAFFTASATVEQSLFNFVQDSIAIANNSLANSNINAFYNLVGIVPVLDTQPTSGVSSSLNWLNGEPAEVAALRNSFGADIVTVYIPFEWNSLNVCGIGNLPRAGGGFNPGPGLFGQKAYTANRNGCGLNDFTLTHEIGHNYGMRHEDMNEGSLDLFPYGRGNLLTAGGQQKATIMGCTCGAAPKPPCGADISNAVCNRILYFSDPNILYLGVPTGTPPSGSDPGRNNALVGRNQVGAYAAFRPQSTNAPPNATFTVSCCGLVCLFDAGPSSDNAPLPTAAANYKWDFGDGATGTGKTSGHGFSAAGVYRIHLVVYDSGGQTDVGWGSVAPQGSCHPPL